MSVPKLFMILLGCKPAGRHTEQHDVFFGIANELKELVSEIEAFWHDAGKIHIDAWREVTHIDGFRIKVSSTTDSDVVRKPDLNKLFFINLGGYQANRFEEQHYFLLSVKENRAAAIKDAKQTMFFKNNHFGKAVSHIDDKYGIDVDDIYEIEEILSPGQKMKYEISFEPSYGEITDEIHLGYLKLSQLR